MNIDWTIVISAAIASIPLIIAQVAAFITAIRTHSAVQDVKISTNGMKDALVRAALVEGHAEGVADEKQNAYNTGRRKDDLPQTHL